MKEITHEEVRNLFGGTECSFDGCPDETNKLHDYITQQQAKEERAKKEHELLGLYQEKEKLEYDKNQLGYLWNKKEGTLTSQISKIDSNIYPIKDKIEKLEEELK